MLMKETAKLRRLITKRGTLEILIPLCCSTNPVRYIKFRNTLKALVAARLKELESTAMDEEMVKGTIRDIVTINVCCFSA